MKLTHLSLRNLIALHKWRMSIYAELAAAKVGARQQKLCGRKKWSASKNPLRMLAIT
jgi:hypothetical protein